MILQVLGTWKCMTHRHKIDARKRYAKNTENYAKMDPKWKPKSLDKLKRWEKRHQKWEPKKHMIFGKVRGEIFFPPDLPKWIQINKITYRRTTKRRQPTADNLQKIIQRLSADRLCARGGRTAVSKANTPRTHSGPVRISVAYGNIPAPGLRKEKARSQDFFRIVFWMDTEGITTEIVIKCMSKSQFSDPKPSKYHQNGSKINAKSIQKTRLCFGNVFGKL